ncbi:hypothetical protein PPROV_000671200 [Pycnococcus provasolii]|uniref:cysteine--tRNA ligase n=1 Tax=Pycnococcus provasolii TaxID=41880 RepID=A0A830HQB9_9CHLO|nr:hypothetical protein PPROV_000671200 [Pycnococcus provasolii]
MANTQRIGDALFSGACMCSTALKFVPTDASKADAAMFAQPCRLNGHPAWCQPIAGRATGLKVNNTLTGEPVPFVPRSGNAVTWYTCGPTVYDVAHMGHARAYLSFDILRRIMEDYFHYDVLFQVNITDIDDKIILRARRNKLFEDYRQTMAGNVDGICDDAVSAATNVRDKSHKKLQQLREPLPPTAGGREAAEQETAIKEQELKARQAEEQLAATGAAAAAARAERTDASRDALLDAARDAIMDKLDTELGDTVTDQSVFMDHARHYEGLFFDDMAALGVRPFDCVTRVSEYVPECVSFIETLISRGRAYEANGSVYFDTRSHMAAGHEYPKLVPSAGAGATAREMAEGEGALSGGDFTGEKRSASDFALWKGSKRGEPAWDSPWGAGRPGWHIECSVMASDVIGGNMDIHAGGSDLCFPHHDNEIAQSEAYWDNGQWVNYFLHAGHLHIQGLKMSKSLKNFITIKQALEVHGAKRLRMLFLLQHWDKPMQFSDAEVENAKKKEGVIKSFVTGVAARMREVASTGRTAPKRWGEPEKALAAHLLACQGEVDRSLKDNFNTPSAIAALLDLVAEGNRYTKDAGDDRVDVDVLRRCAAFVSRTMRIFGMYDGLDAVAEDEERGEGGAGGGGDGAIDAAVGFRDEVRSLCKGGADSAKTLASSLLDACDRFRDESMVKLGVRVEDRASGKSMWKRENPEDLQREVEEKRAAERERAMAKAKAAQDKAGAELDKFAPAHALDAMTMFRDGASYAGKYSDFDERGVPTKLVDGEEIPKSQKKSLEKELTRVLKLKDDLTTRASKAHPDATDAAEAITRYLAELTLAAGR